MLLIARPGGGNSRLDREREHQLHPCLLGHGDLAGEVKFLAPRSHLLESKPAYSCRGPKQYVCSECGNEFQHNKRGRPKRCLSCRTIASDADKLARRERSRSYMAQYRKTEKYRSYKRDWTRRDRIKKKMLAMDPTSLAEILKEVAATISNTK